MDMGLNLSDSTLTPISNPNPIGLQIIDSRLLKMHQAGLDPRSMPILTHKAKYGKVMNVNDDML